MKKVLLILLTIFMFGGMSGILSASDIKTTCSAIAAAAPCNPVSPTTYTQVLKQGTCTISGTHTGINVDIDGSIDGVNYSPLYDDATANGNYSFVNMPYKYIRGDVDAIATGTVTVTCVWPEELK